MKKASMCFKTWVGYGTKIKLSEARSASLMWVRRLPLAAVQSATRLQKQLRIHLLATLFLIVCLTRCDQLMFVSCSPEGEVRSRASLRFSRQVVIWGEMDPRFSQRHCRDISSFFSFELWSHLTKSNTALDSQEAWESLLCEKVHPWPWAFFDALLKILELYVGRYPMILTDRLNNIRTPSSKQSQADYLTDEPNWLTDTFQEK